MTGRTTYIQACKMNGVIPVSYFLRNVQSPKLDMKHHGIGASGTKAISIALVVRNLNMNAPDLSVLSVTCHPH